MEDDMKEISNSILSVCVMMYGVGDKTLYNKYTGRMKNVKEFIDTSEIDTLIDMVITIRVIKYEFEKCYDKSGEQKNNGVLKLLESNIETLDLEICGRSKIDIFDKILLAGVYCGYINKSITESDTRKDDLSIGAIMFDKYNLGKHGFLLSKSGSLI